MLIWDSWEWDADGGEKWTESEAWKDSVIREVLRPRVPEGSDVLEIGPGAGRWTETLAELAGSLTLVDISSRCIEICRDRFGHLEGRVLSCHLRLRPLVHRRRANRCGVVI